MTINIISLLIGALIGVFCGLWFHAKVLDKPEVENNFNSEIKNKRGIFHFLFNKKKEF